MTINQLVNEACGSDLQTVTAQSATELSSVLAGCNVNFAFRPHRVNLYTGKHGIRWLICDILAEAQAVFPQYNGNFRNVYLAYGLTTAEICAKVRNVNGFERYPDHTIVTYLSSHMQTGKAQVASIRMTNSEDKNRTCKPPRNKWYLLPDWQLNGPTE